MTIRFGTQEQRQRMLERSVNAGQTSDALKPGEPSDAQIALLDPWMRPAAAKELLTKVLAITAAPPALPPSKPDRYAWDQHMDHGNGMGWIEQVVRYDPRSPEYAELHRGVDWDNPSQVRNFRALYAAAPPAQPDAPKPGEPVGEVAGYFEKGFDTTKTLYGKIWNQDLPMGAKLYTERPAQAALKPAGEIVSASCEYATVKWFAQTSEKGGGDPKNSYSWPITGDVIYLVHR